MTKKRKASLGLGALGQNDNAESQSEASFVAAESHALASAASVLEKATDQKYMDVKKKKKQILPLYIEPALHDALHTLIFSERHKKATFQTLFMEGLDLALKERGLPSVAELSSGEKTLNL